MATAHAHADDHHYTATGIDNRKLAIWTNRDGDGETGVTPDTPDQIEVPSGSVLVTLASSNTKESWLNQVVEKFNAAQIETSGGSPIVVSVSHVTSGGSMNAILDGSSQPTAWSPGDQSWVEQANDAWRQRTNKPLASQSCAPTIYAPLGFAMWQPMAETLGWPETPIGGTRLWNWPPIQKDGPVMAVPSGASSALDIPTRATPIPACWR